MKMNTASRIRNKRTLSFALLSLLLLVACVQIALPHNAPFPMGYDSTNFVIDTIGDPETLDPAWAYLALDQEVIKNVYEPLIFFDVKYEDGPLLAGKNDSFVPKLATALPTIEYFNPPLINPKSGLDISVRWTFQIRTSVPFHFSGNILTPADVEYSFERGMVQDRGGGPQSNLFVPLLQETSALSPDLDPEFGLKIDGSVESDATYVWFNLVADYPELDFKRTLSQTWSSVVEKAWAVAEGDLDLASVPGGWINWQYIWDTWHNPAVSFLEDAIDHLQKDGGTGPYKMDYWNYGVGGSAVRNTAYWDGWPARISVGSAQRLGGYVDRVTWCNFQSWTARRTRFLAGDSDVTIVPTAYRSQVLGQVVGGEMIRCYRISANARKFEQAWMRGWYYNSLYLGEYAYHRWKAKTHFGDVDWDGAVNILDSSAINSHWYPGPPIGPAGFNPRADINGGVGVTTGELTGPLRGISDGRVDILDWAMPSRYWDAGSGGLLHPGGGSTVPAPEITTSVSPLRITKSVGETFSVNLTVSAVQYLLGYHYILRYNTTVLTAVSFTNLAYLVDPQFTLEMPRGINDAEGYVVVSYMTSSTNGFTTTETRPLLSITFQVDAAGTSPLDIDEDESRLVDVGARAWIYPYNLKVNDGILTTPEVAVSPQITVGPPPRIGESFTVNMTITDVIDLYTWQAGMTFNPSVLECLSIAEGEFLKRAGVLTLWAPGTINNAIGEIGYSAGSLTGATLGVNGTGQLMSITFGVKGSGISTLHPTDVLLLDSNLVSITPVNIVDGHVEIHVQDIAILSVTKTASEAYPTWTVPFNVTVVVENQGTRTETFDVTAYAGAILIGTKTVALDAGANTALVYNWNLEGVAEGIYTIRAEVPPLYGEIDTADNTLTDGTVKIKHPGDANDDGVLNAYDLGILAKAWGTKVGDALYDPRADFNGDGKIDTQDHEILKDYWP